MVTGGTENTRQELEKDEAAADTERHSFCASSCAELPEDGSDVEFCGVVGDIEASGDLLVTQACSQHLQDFALAAGKRLGKFCKWL